MKSTGCVRRIDDLGRIVIPKAIRQELGIKEGEPLEIFKDDNNNIVLKRYQPSINDIKEELKDRDFGDLIEEYAPNTSLIKQAVIEYIDEWFLNEDGEE